MFLHTVLFWLKSNISKDDILKFEDGLKRLTKIETVKFKYIGKPAATRRPVIDSSYSYKLVVGFDGIQGHDYYQDIKVHKDFIAECADYWVKVLVYDAEEIEE